MKIIHEQIVKEIGEVVLPCRVARSNPRDVKRKMSGYLLRSRSTQKKKSVKKKIQNIELITN